VRGASVLVACAVAVAVAGCGDNDFAEAPHADLPQVMNLGGPIAKQPRFVVVTFHGDPLDAQIHDFVSALASSNYWHAVTSEYGVGTPTVTALRLPDVAPAMTSDIDIRNFIYDAIFTRAVLPTPNENTIYALFYPSGTTMPGACTTYAGYHSIAIESNTRFAYAVMPRCPNGSLDTFDFITQVASHEFAEASTDPEPGIATAYGLATDYAWSFYGGGNEIGDMCDSVSQTILDDTGYVVPRIWSNAAAAAGTDPCVPHPSGDVYVQAAPDGLEDLSISTSLSPALTVMSRGLQIAVGSTQVIPIRLFSDAPTAPLTVWTEQIAVAGATPDRPDLSLALDKHSGVNGDVLQLSVTVNADTAGYGHEVFVLHTQLGSSLSTWPVVVAN